MTWSCDATRTRLFRQMTLPAEAMEHIAQCALCQDMASVLPSTTFDEHEAPASIDVAAAYVQTRHRIGRERGVSAWLRSRGHAQQLTLGIALAVAPALIVSFVAHRADLRVYPTWRLGVFVAGLLFASLLTLQALLRPLYVPRSRTSEGVSSVLAFGLPLLLGVLAPAHAVALDHGDPSTQTVVSQAYACLRLGILVGLPSLLLLLAMDRVQHARFRFTALAAGLGGVVGNLTLLMHCANEQRAHRLLGHATVGVSLLLLCVIVSSFFRSRMQNRA
jgi:hypothetical protein